MFCIITTPSFRIGENNPHYKLTSHDIKKYNEIAVKTLKDICSFLDMVKNDDEFNLKISRRISKIRCYKMYYGRGI